MVWQWWGEGGKGEEGCPASFRSVRSRARSEAIPSDDFFFSSSILPAVSPLHVLHTLTSSSSSPSSSSSSSSSPSSSHTLTQLSWRWFLVCLSGTGKQEKKIILVQGQKNLWGENFTFSHYFSVYHLTVFPTFALSVSAVISKRWDYTHAHRKGKKNYFVPLTCAEYSVLQEFFLYYAFLFPI